MTDIRSSLPHISMIAPDHSNVIEGSFSEKKLGGPKTAIGKRRSSRNSLKAGLYTSATVIRGENEAEYLSFARTIVAGLDVQNAVEMAIAERVVSALWRARRVRYFEAAQLNLIAAKVERLRQNLADAERELLACEREEKAVCRIVYPVSLPSELLWTASDGIMRIAKEYLDSDALLHAESKVCDAIPSRKRATKVMVTEFGVSVCNVLQPLFETQLSSTRILLWTSNQLSNASKGLRFKRNEASQKYEEALAWSFILPDKIGFRDGQEHSREAGPGKALADAEGRLDRQVSRALADFKTVRELRNNGESAK